MPRLILFTVSIIFLQSCHVGRFFIYNFADVKDHKKFPEKKIRASSEPFYFKEGGSVPFNLPANVVRNGKEVSYEKAHKRSGTYAFIVIRNDSIIHEWYRKGFAPSRLHPSFSVAKSFISALIGIAIKEGHIRDTEEPITNYIDFKDKEAFSKIKIRHLLDMQSGIEFNENYFNPLGDIAKYYYGTRLKKYISKLRTESEPGTKFRYISVNTQLLALILEKATGKKVSAYLEEKLWQPLGMEYDASWNIDSKKGDTEKAFCCINGRAKDFAKLGRLYLNKGNWNGKEIVPASYVEQSVNFRDNTNRFLYSHQWWHTRNISPLKDSTLLKQPFYIYYPEKAKQSPFIFSPSGDFFAQGFLGQYVYVSPENNMIIVRLAKKEGGVLWPILMRKMADSNHTVTGKRNSEN